MERITPEEYRTILERGAQRSRKYGNRFAYRCKPCGAPVDPNHDCLICGESAQIRFPSQGEAARYDHLRSREFHGEIHCLKTHPVYPIKINGQRVCVVELDFGYFDGDGKLVVEDFKGKDNALSKLKRRLVEAQYGFKVTIVKRPSE